MQHLILVLVGAIGIGLGLGAAIFVPKGSGDAPQEASAASAFEMFKDEETNEEEDGAGVPARELYEVVKVIDGDTVTIKMNGENETVRLIGIDTPETNDVRTGVQCFGVEATAQLKKIIGKRVAVEKDAGEGERDKYDRLLAYLYAENGVHLNQRMVEDGYAYEYTYDDVYKYQKEFKAAEAGAKEAGRGLWAPDACPPEVVSPKPTPSIPKISAPVVTPPAAVLGTTTVSEPEQKQEEPEKKEEPKPEPEPEPQPKKEEPKPAGNYTCSSNTYNCSHFKTQAEAQSVFDQCGGVDNDVHRLDGNKDGEVCESLP